MSNNHDEHYQALEARGVSVIKCMEIEVCMGIPSEFHAIARRNLSNALAMKYQLRAGRKGGLDGAEADIEKMANYRHRAETGKWRGES